MSPIVGIDINIVELSLASRQSTAFVFVFPFPSTVSLPTQSFQHVVSIQSSGVRCRSGRSTLLRGVGRSNGSQHAVRTVLRRRCCGTDRSLHDNTLELYHLHQYCVEIKPNCASGDLRFDPFPSTAQRMGCWNFSHPTWSDSPRTRILRHQHCGDVSATHLPIQRSVPCKEARMVRAPVSGGILTNANMTPRLTLCNLCLTMFLAMKNTPLSPLAGRSYESVNVLHRCAGYTTIVAMLLHSTVYIQSLVKSSSTFLLEMSPQHAAVFAAFCLIVIGVTASSPFRKRQYELFFMIHVTMVMGILIARKFHTFQNTVRN